MSQRNSQSMNTLRMANQWRCRMNSIRSSAMSDVFIILFISLPHFWFICKIDPCLHYLRVLALLVVSPRLLQIFIQLEQCASYRKSRQILSRRHRVPNKRCVLHNECAPDNPILQYSNRTVLKTKHPVTCLAHTLRVTLFSTGGKFHLVSNSTKLHPLTLAIRSYVLLF